VSITKVPIRTEMFSHVPYDVPTLSLVNNDERGFKVDLSVELIRKINALSDQRGMKNKAVAARVLAWFLVQPVDIQSVILGQIPADAEFLELVLRRMTTTIGASPSSDDPPAGGPRRKPKGGIR
jgi:alkyl hydroperoxide reductase subunit AhpF